jgi:transcription elongation GreA/GreB family factor
MNTTPIYVSVYDHHRLRELLATTEDRARRRDLSAELERAVIIPPHVRFPTYVVTVGTHVTLQDLATDEVTDVVLTIPGCTSSATASEVSVLEPLGTALLGCMHGDVIALIDGGVARTLKVIQVVQSSVAGAAATLAAT